MKLHKADQNREASSRPANQPGMLAGLSVISLALLSAIIPMGASGRTLASYLPALPCLFQELTSLPCPFCGMTRAFMSMGRLEVAQALGFSVAGSLLFVYLSALALTGWIYVATRSRLLGAMLVKNHLPYLLAAVLSLWAARLAWLF